MCSSLRIFFEWQFKWLQKWKIYFNSKGRKYEAVKIALEFYSQPHFLQYLVQLEISRFVKKLKQKVSHDYKCFNPILQVSNYRLYNIPGEEEIIYDM